MVRPLQSQPWKTAGATESEAFAFHVLDLRPSLDDIYRTHKSTLNQDHKRRNGDSPESGAQSL